VRRERCEKLLAELKATRSAVAPLQAAALAEILASHPGPRVDFGAFAGPLLPYLAPLLDALRVDAADDPGGLFKLGPVRIDEALRLAEIGLDAWSYVNQHIRGSHGDVGELADVTLAPDDRLWAPTLPAIGRNRLAIDEGRGIILSRYPRGAKRIGVVTILAPQGVKTLVFPAGGYPQAPRREFRF
jgi:hypothetical protein